MNYSLLAADELVGLCLQTGNADAWKEFIRRFNPLISAAVLRTARAWGVVSRSVQDDLVQETYLKLCANNCKLLRRFEFRQPGGLFGFLKVVATNVAHDHFRTTYAAKRGSREADQERVTETSEADVQPWAAHERSVQASIEHEILIGEIDQCLVKVVAPEELKRSRKIFWLYYRCGFSANAIAALADIGLTTKGVESTLFRLVRMIREAMVTERRARETDKRLSLDEPKGIRESSAF